MNCLRPLLAAVAAAVLGGCASPAPRETFDLAITGARIVDGTGAPAFTGTMLVQDGRIARVIRGEGAAPPAARAIDAAGRVLAPGFIDAHAHGDPLYNRTFANFVSQGVTTIVLGQDGDTPGYEEPGDDDPSLTLAEWMARAEGQGLDVNIAALSGHGSLRYEAGVGQAATPSAAQLEEMRRLLRRDFAAGAFGMSSGLEYVPGLNSSAPELVELARVVGAADGVVMSHMRSEDDDKVDAALGELLEQGEHARVHFSHMKVVLGHGPAHGEAIIARMRAARAAGVEVSGDVYPYLAGFADISLVLPTWAKTQAQFDLAKRTRRAELEAHVRRRIESRNGPDAILIASGPQAGKTLKEAAEAAGKPFWVYAVEDMGPGGPNCAHFVMDAALQDVFLTSDLTSISTDGAPWMSHPRSWGTYARFIETYVVKRRAMTLEEAIRKLTSLPAGIVGITDRGRIAPGQAADLVLFDPAKVHERATWIDSKAMSEGFDLVLINGVPAFEAGAMTGARPGRILRKPAR